MVSASKPRSTNSAERTLRLLQFLAQRSRAVSLAELSSALVLPKPTVHRLCQTLLDMRMITRHVDEKTYVLGPAMRHLAFDALNNSTLRGLRHAILGNLVKNVGETCNLTTLDGAQVLYLDRVETQHPWKLTIDVGEHVPVHCTASGKLFLALMPPRARNTLLGRLDLLPLTKHTKTCATELRTEFNTITAIGHAEDREEFVTGLIALAVPVYDSEERLRAALAMQAPINRVDLAAARDMLPALHEAASAMSELI